MQAIKKINIKIKLKESGKVIFGYYYSKRNKIIFVDEKEDIISEDDFSIIGSPILTYCDICKCEMCCKLYTGLLKKEKRICNVCLSSGENNPFYGKKHTEEFKNRLSKERKGTWYTGENNAMKHRNIFIEKSPEEVEEIKKKISEACSGEKNGFYNKHHTEETKKRLKETSTRNWNNLSEEEKKIISEKTSISQKNMLLNNPEKYRNDRIKACRESHKSQFKNKKMNSIEKIVFEEMMKREIHMEYSVIFCYKQFDFGNKECKILLEVHGDYWHANPDMYGDGKKDFTYMQKLKIKADKEKQEIALTHGFKLFIIWESDVKKGNFQVLEKIKEIINANTI